MGETPALEAMPNRDMVAAYAEAGIDRSVIAVPTLGRDDALQHLDRAVSG